MTATTTLVISRAAATALLGWLESTPLNSIPVSASSDRQALADLLTALEQSAPEATADNLEEARAVLIRRAGPWVDGGEPPG